MEKLRSNWMIFMTLLFAYFSKICRESPSFLKILTRIAGILYEDLLTFMIISSLILVRMRNVSDKKCRENQNTHFMFYDFFFRKPCRLWGNVEKYGRRRQDTDNRIKGRRFTCWVPKSTDTYSYYETLIAFPLQNVLRQCASVFRWNVCCLSC